MKTIVIYHRADFDGIFCREIARKFLPEAELVGWDFADPPLAIPSEGQIYVLDLPVDRVFGLTFGEEGHLPWLERVIWIDHHKSSIETHNKSIPGYRIDGVAACRLTWQWFTNEMANRVMGDPSYLPIKQDFVDRKVEEPVAVRLAGEYDIWDKRDPDAELLQHGLRSQELSDEDWKLLLFTYRHTQAENGLVTRLLRNGEALQYAKKKENASIIENIGFDLDFEGLHFLACNAAQYNSHLFTAGLKPEHDACFGFKWTGKDWSVSLYHAPGKEHHDLSRIAVKHGGGGHRGACGFRVQNLTALGIA